MKLDFLKEFDFFTGVPDSQLRALCDYLMFTYGIDPRHHIIAANEGNAVGLAAGYHLATGRVPVVYLQNSGEGNIINPVASLMNDRVYGIPCLFIVGWRGQPGIHDEPQHVYQGQVTLKLLEDMDISCFIITRETKEEDVQEELTKYRELWARGKQCAFVICKDALEFDGKVVYKNANSMTREEIIRHIVVAAGDDPIVSTTGKASRELFEIREANGQGHERDFLTVGSMGHSSSIALGIALKKPETKVWCIDGDGAALMHMGAMAVIGALRPKNIVHIIINNGVHESVGGMPTVADKIDFVGIARACGYEYMVSVSEITALDRELDRTKKRSGLMMIEVKSAIGSRTNLGRPTTKTMENKNDFMKFLMHM